MIATKTEEQFFSLFEGLRKKTGNFTVVEEDILVENQVYLLISRHIFSMNQKQFSKLLGISRSYLSELETTSKPLNNKKLRKLLVKKIRNRISRFNKYEICFKSVFLNYMSSVESCRLTKERAKLIRTQRKVYPELPHYKKISLGELLKKWKHIIGSSELAYIIAKINGDGHLQLDNNYRSLVCYCSKNLEEIREFKKIILKYFKIKGAIYYDKRENRIRYKIVFCSKELCIFLENFGAIVGKKTKKEFLIPTWILNGNQEIKSAYLRGLFDTEGYVSFDKESQRWRIGIAQYKEKELVSNGNQYMSQVKNLVESFNISCSNICILKKNKLRKDGSRTIGFKFSFERKDFGKFYNWIGFNNFYKQSKLRTALFDGPVAKNN